MAKLESKLEQDLVDACADQGMSCLKLVEVGRKGFPDRTIMADMTPPVYVEVKRDAKHGLSPHQVERKEELEARGYTVLVLDRTDQIADIISHVRNKAPYMVQQNRVVVGLRHE